MAKLNKPTFIAKLIEDKEKLSIRERMLVDLLDRYIVSNNLNATVALKLRENNTLLQEQNQL